MENYMLFFFVGLLLFAITCYVHRHSYVREIYSGKDFNKMHRRPFPLWMILLFFVVSMIPIINVIAFFVGAIIYLIEFTDENRFSFRNIEGQDYMESKSTFIQKVQDFFTFDLNKIKKKKE